MTKNRLEAFTDAIIAIVMTVLVLNLHQPASGTFAALFAAGHKFLVYLISFVILAIYWNNHHHMLQLVTKIDGRTLWANNLLILALTLFPFATAWVSDFPTKLAPQFFCGCILLIADVSYYILGRVLSRANGAGSAIQQLTSSCHKSRNTIILNVIALFAGVLFQPVFIIVLNLFSLLPWIIPEKLAEKIQ